MLSNVVVYRTIPTSNHNHVASHKKTNLLYIVLFLHQTTTRIHSTCLFLSCISYYSYIKPQLYFYNLFFINVVYRTIPTSNHNLFLLILLSPLLYIVLFLHQTTTIRRNVLLKDGLYIVLFLHQTTTVGWRLLVAHGCISYYSYIKPQLCDYLAELLSVVYRTIPTSNHNIITDVFGQIPLYIVLFLHQTTTDSQESDPSPGCISYYSYIKPQL